MSYSDLLRAVVANQKEALLLDQYPGAVSAHSLRYLLSSYTGNVILVRRSSDDSEAGFTPTEITDGTLEAFCGAGDGFVKTLYDQVENYDFSQTTQSRQPKIVDSGTLIENNGFPSMQFSGGQFIGIASPTIFTSAMSVFNVAQVTNTGSETRAWVFHNSGSPAFFLHRCYTNNNSIRAYLNDGGAKELSFPYSTWNDIHIFYMTAVSNDYMEAVVNNQTLQSKSIGNFSASTGNNFGLGAGRLQTNNSITGHIFETISYNSDESANASGIIEGLNNHYGVF